MMNPEIIPATMRDARQWVVWKLEDRQGRPTKVPYCATTGRRASSVASEDWCGFDIASNAASGYSGIGFVFVADGGVVGIDIDNCIEDGRPKAWAEPILRGFNTYSEISPSGKGVKMWVGGKLPGDRGTRRPYHDGAVEMYDRGRFFTVTGNLYDESPSAVNPRQKHINRLWELIHAAPDIIKPPPVPATTLADAEIVRHLVAKYNTKAARLFQGNMTGYLSPSEADAALVCKIAFYTRDPAQIDRIYRASMLCREKWTEREDYRTATIESALSRVSEVWTPTKAKAPAPETNIAAPPPATTGSGSLGVLLDETISGQRVNIPWPWPTLTFAARALMPGSVVALCGGAGSTKSMLMSEASLFWLDHGIPFAMFHLEKDRAFHLHRALAQLENDSNLTLDDYIRAHPDEARAAYERQRATLDALGSCMWDAPESEVTVADLADWARDRAKSGARVITIDPITAADSGDKPWQSDRRFILAANKAMADYKATLILVTHPRDGNASKTGSRLDNLAGGRAYNRMTDAVLWLESMPEPEDKTVRKLMEGGGYFDTVEPCNRVVQIHKARNGRGNGLNIGYTFSGDTLRFVEHGAIREDRR